MTKSGEKALSAVALQWGQHLERETGLAVVAGEYVCNVHWQKSVECGKVTKSRVENKMNLFIFYPETELLRRVAAKLRKKIEDGALIVHALIILYLLARFFIK